MALNINGTTGISGVDGSASAPALQGTDSNTGINFASDTVNINTGGSTRATVASNGFLGVGTTSPSSTLSVEQSSSNISADLHATGSGRGSQIKFHNDHGLAYIGQGGDTSGDFIIFNSTASNIKFYTNDNEHMRINSSGAIRAGVSSAIQTEKYSWFRPEGDQSTLAYFHEGATADVSGIIMRHGRGLSGFSGKMISFCRNDGNEVGSITVGVSSTAFNTSSDYRLKENVTSITDGITRLKTLKPYRFNFKDDTTKPVIDGFFAHEVTAVPEAITGTKDEVDSDNNPVYQSIDQSKLIPLLTAALQEAVAKIEVLETKVAALEAG